MALARSIEDRLLETLEPTPQRFEALVVGDDVQPVGTDGGHGHGRPLWLEILADQLYLGLGALFFVAKVGGTIAPALSNPRRDTHGAEHAHPDAMGAKVLHVGPHGDSVAALPWNPLRHPGGRRFFQVSHDKASTLPGERFG
jgi:hypothetical protein